MGTGIGLFLDWENGIYGYGEYHDGIYMNVGNVSDSRISAGNEFHNLAPS
jgi:hypothetical protein